MEAIYSEQAVVLSLLNGKNNGFTTNDWQEKKHVFVYLVDFVQCLHGTNFARSAFEDCPVWGKNCKIPTNYPHLLSKGG